jgi:hypothetical protein
MSDTQKQGVFRRAVQRIMAQKMSMTVDSVIAGYTTVNEFRSVIKRFIGNLLHSDLARGWKKWRLLQQIKVKEKANLAQSKEWASRFMTDALFANRQMQVKSAEDVRQEIVTAMQKAFKRMRRARLMAGSYTFPHGTPSRMEHAREGFDVILSFQGLQRTDVYKLCCDEEWVKEKYVKVELLKAGVSHGLSHTTTLSARGAEIDRYSFLKEYIEAVEAKEAIRPHATLFEGDASYSDCDVPINRGMLHFSDNLSMVKFCVGKPSGKEHSQLNKAEHSYFVQSETISCVIVNAEHHNANADGGTTSAVKIVTPIDLPESADTSAGHWVTICGPKVSFGRKFVEGKGKDAGKMVVGGPSVKMSHEIAAEFGQENKDLFQRADSGGMSCAFLRISITVSKATLKDLFPKDENIVGKKTKVRFSFLGKTTESSVEKITDAGGAVGMTPADPKSLKCGYNAQGQAVGVVYVPYFDHKESGKIITEDISVYDNSHCVFDVIEVVRDDTIVGAEPKNKIIGTYECHLSSLVDFMRSGNVPSGQAPPPSGVPAASPTTIRRLEEYTYPFGGPVLQRHLRLSVPDRVHDSSAVKEAEIMVTFSSEKAEAPIEARDGMRITSSDVMMPVSPGAIGAGTSSTMFTSHKGAYFDGRKGPGKFSVDHVGNCLEVFVKSIHLPDKPAKDGLRYFALVRCGGAVRTTPAYVRPPYELPAELNKKTSVHEAARKSGKAPWSNVLSDSDPKTVPMLQTLYLPLAADIFTRDSIDIELWCLDLPEPKAVSFQEAQSSTYNNDKSTYTETFLGKAQIDIDRLMVGDERGLDNLRVATGAVYPEYEGFTCALLVEAPQKDGWEKAPFMNVSYALRDKDLSKIDDRRDVFNIGDGVILPIEESVEYLLPVKSKSQDKEEITKFNKMQEIKFRKLFAPKPNKEQQERKVLPLRKPHLRSELDMSGMEGIQDFFFKQHAIPDYCEDPVPHQYIIARSEKDHERRGCQGSYYRVLNELAARSDVKKDKVVDSLSHLVRGFNCTVVAMYADRTATLEISVRTTITSAGRNPGIATRGD